MKRLAAFREIGTLALLILVIVGSTLKEPRFLQPTSINSMLLWVPLLAIVGIGEMMVIVTRGIDVSVGSLLGLVGMLVGMTFRSHPHMPVAMGAVEGIGLGFLFGSLNGLLVAWAKIPPIIATLGTLSAYRGLVFIVSRGVQIDSNDIPEALTNWSLKGPLAIGGVTLSWLLAIAILLCVLAGVFLKYTRAGRNIFALGSNPEAARLRGIPVTKTTFLVYAVAGACAGLAGVMYASRYGFVNPATAGQGFELTVIAAVAIGGVKIAGGSGSIFGVFLGCFVLAGINVSLAVLGIEGAWQSLVYGCVILLALLSDTIFRRTLDRQEVRA